ncbi:unnamed protein product [Cylindrotheca closterium]|uniref:AAA+ ATPase domain-containing protein n=1 Tax=Cylindrotheca closterium TaxID=2856 RepID=A0AAD2FSQ7_9STRA|nr:unnamed protein product [Cylindrotheca closterium]
METETPEQGDTFAMQIDPSLMEGLRDLDPDDPNFQSQEAFEKLAMLKLPAGWKRNPAKTPPYIHEDGRVSWKNPAWEQIMAIAAAKTQQTSKTPDLTQTTMQDSGLIKKYRRMMSCGIAVNAIRNTARIDGMDPDAVTLALSTDNPLEQEINKPAAAVSSLDAHEQRYLKKYKRMLKSGVPSHGVATTIRMDGFEPSLVIDEQEACVLESPKFERLPQSTARKSHLTNKYQKMAKAGVSTKAIKSVMIREEGTVDESLLATLDDDTINDETPRYFSPTSDGGVEFHLDNATTGKESHLSLLVRKMALTVKRSGKNSIVHQGNKTKTLKVEGKDLYDALGGLRGVQVARDLYNRTCHNDSTHKVMSEQEICSKRKPLLELWSSLGIRAPTRPNGTVDISGLDDLVEFIEKSNENKLGAIKECVKDGMCDFDSLGELYRPGTRVVAKHVFASGVDMVCEVAWNRYEQGKTLFGVTRTFKVCFQFLVAVGKHFTLCEYVHGMENFEGRRSIQSSLDFVPLSSMNNNIKDVLATFRKRGEKYAKCATSQSFMAYEKGSFFAKSVGRKAASANNSALNTSGRVMVDTQGSYEAGHSLGIASNDMIITAIKYKYKEYMLHQRKMEQDAKSGLKQSNDHNLILFDDIPDDYLEMSWPAVIGFSFTSNSWGEVLVDGLSDIQFDETVFDSLVLPASRKRMVKALVRHSSDSFQDIIAGKGEGSVFLLYGPPGVGKTLTAEAISEMLHRPLYTVSLGQLGTTPSELETKLGEILDLCRRWDALILLDEADIFLEKRTSTGSLERNAMVSIMLRLVEYFKGVLFLTSNRVDTLDPAFKTRITLGLRYEQLNSDARLQVWKNLLGASGYAAKLGADKAIDIEELAKHQLNGREIKNAIRLAMALAQEDDEDLSQKLLLETIETLNDFNEKMNTAEAY